jgi:hypothetical protein
MVAFCRISHPSGTGPKIPIEASSGHFEGVANPAVGVYSVSLAGGYELVGPVHLQVSATQPNVVVSAEFEHLPNGAYHVRVTRHCGGQPQNGDAWLSGTGIEEIS